MAGCQLLLSPLLRLMVLLLAAAAVVVELLVSVLGLGLWIGLLQTGAKIRGLSGLWEIWIRACLEGKGPDDVVADGAASGSESHIHSQPR